MVTAFRRFCLPLMIVAIGLAFLVADAALFSPAPAVRAVVAGGGPTVEAFSVDAEVSIESVLGTETIPLIGSVVIERSAPRTEGGVEVTDLEIVSLSLIGTSVTGTVLLRESTTLSSVGEIRGLQPSPAQFPAASFIELFYQVEVPGSPGDPLTLHNTEALHLVPTDGGTEVPLTAWPPDGVAFRSDPVPCKPLLPVLPGHVCVTSASFVVGAPLPPPTPTATPTLVPTPTLTPTPGPVLKSLEVSAEVSVESLLGTETIPFTGSVVIERSVPRTEGGVEVTDLEIVSLDLTGTSVTGTVLLRQSPTLVSAGEIRGLQPSPDQFPASSFIDLFFEVDVPGSPGDPLTLHNTEALHLVPMDDGSEVPLTAWPPDGVTFRADPDPCKPLLPVLPGLVCVTSAVFVVGAALPPPTPTPTPTTPPFVLEGPSFSVAPGGPSGLHPADVLDRDPAVRVAFSCAGLALTADGCDTGADGDQDDLDALSYGHDFRQQAAPVTFSVASASAGAAGSDVAAQAACSPAQPQADIFSTGLDQTNTLLFDGDGANTSCDTATAVGLLEIPDSDDIDAFESQSAAAIDIELDGEPDAPVFFSLAAGSPSLSAFGRSGADILWTVGGTQPGVFAFGRAIGLQPGDDIDGLCVADDGDAFFEPGIDAIAFSLAPASPTLADLGASPADLLGPGPELFVAAEALGLVPDDDLNAMSCGPGVGPEIVAQVRLDPATQSVNAGQAVVVDVEVAAVTGLAAYEIEIPFDLELLSFVSVENSAFLGSSGRFPSCFGPSAERLNLGIVFYACGTSGSAAPGVSGSGLLATVTFEATCTPGSTDLDLEIDLLEALGDDIPAQVSGATVTIEGECQTGTPTPTPTDVPADSPTPTQAGPTPTATPFTDVLGLPLTGSGQPNAGAGGLSGTLATVLAAGIGVALLRLGIRRFRRS